MIINLIDPALRLAAGHHLDLGSGVAHTLRHAGHDVHVYYHAHISSEASTLLRRHAAFTPLFRLTPYEAPGNGAGETAAWIDAAKSIAEDLRKVRRAEAWLWPSMFSIQALACTLVNPAPPIVGCLHVEPGYLARDGSALWRHAFAAAADAGTRLRLGAFEPMLREQYDRLPPPMPFAPLAIPYDRSRPTRQHERMIWVGFFGAQRDEKGVSLIQNLMPRLFECGLNVVLHDSSGGSSGRGDARFRALFGYVEDLAAEIAACDLVVTPYNPETYRTKGSAIVWSAIANGVPVVAPRNTASGSLIEQSGAGTTFAEYSADSVFAALIDARDRYPAIAQCARDASERWLAEHGLQKHVASLLAALPGTIAPR